MLNCLIHSSYISYQLPGFFMAISLLKCILHRNISLKWTSKPTIFYTPTLPRRLSFDFEYMAISCPLLKVIPIYTIIKIIYHLYHFTFVKTVYSLTVSLKLFIYWMVSSKIVKSINGLRWNHQLKWWNWQFSDGFA